ncbi:MAG: OmpA family protein [Spirochaetes bacterium]|nr:OmpA family protein [Spirochaetota bacterium]
MKKSIIIIMILCCIANSIKASILLDFPHYNSRLYGSAESLLVEKGDLNNIEIFPASISSIQGQALSMGYIKWSDIVNIMRIGYGHNLKNIGVIGGSINFGTLQETKNYDEYGNILGNLKVSDVLLNIGYGKEISKNVQAGLNIKYLNMNLDGYRSSWIGAGLSGLISFNLPGINLKGSENFNLGLGIQDINLVKAKFINQDSEYPVRIYGGFTYKFLRTGQVETKIGTTYTFLTEYKQHYISSGLEFGFNRLIFIRYGYYLLGRYSDKMAFGCGIGKDKLVRMKWFGETGFKFDYSFSLLKEGTAHYIQLGLLFMPGGKYKKIKDNEEKNIIIEEDEERILFDIRENNKKLFMNKKGELGNNGKEVINEISKLMKNEDYKRVAIIIYTEKSKAQNKELSETRIKSITRYLVDSEIDKKRISHKIYDRADMEEDKILKDDFKYEILLIRWKNDEEKERFKYYYFNGYDAYIKGGYELAITEWGKALQIDPDNDELIMQFQKAQKAIKAEDGRKAPISVNVETDKEILEKRQLKNITAIVFNYQNKGDSKKWEFLRETIPDSIRSSLDDYNFIRIINKSKVETSISGSGIKISEMYEKKTMQTIGRELKANVIIKGSFTEINRKLQIKTEIWDLRTGSESAVIKVVGEVGANMFDLMDKTVESIITVLRKYQK